MAADSPPPASTLVPFLVLPENRFALESVSMMAEEPSRAVFIYGPSGAGKSHLVRHAVRLFLLRHPQARVEHLTAGEFAAEFAEASVRGTIPLFQAAMREFDLFVLEDVQLLEGRGETLVQLLSLCEELRAGRSQQIWTSRCSPGDLSQFPRKLVSRFRGGVTARLKLPCQASREKLLQHFARLRQISLPADASQALAEGLAVSPRELWASLSQLEALARHERR